jgi:AcrR family transcriptional regulator
MTSSRPYRSPRRALQAEQTRAAVLDSARALFAERGWASAGMRDVAQAAGVSIETVYATHRSKVALLKAALDGAVVGDDEPVPLEQRPQFRAMGEGGFEERARAAAALITDIYVRTIGLQRALREAAGGEPALAEILRAQEANRRRSTEAGMASVLRRPCSQHEIDLFWAQTSPEVYDLLVNHSGWSPQQYADWVQSLVTSLKGRS